MGVSVLSILILLVITLNSSFLQTKLVNYVLKQQTEAMNVYAHVRNVDVDLFSRNVRIIGLTVLDHHQNVLLDAGTLQTNIRSFSSTAVELGVTNIFDLEFHLQRYEEDSVSNLQRILNFFGTSSSDTSLFALKCSRLNLNNANLSYVDEHTSKGDEYRYIDYNNVALNHVNLVAKHVDLLGDQLFASIDELSFKEKKGFEVLKFSARLNLSGQGIIARNLHLKTHRSNLSFDVRLKTESWRDYNDFISNVSVLAKFEPSELDMKDIIPFAPEIEGMHNRMRLSGTVSGYVNHFQTNNFDVSCAHNTTFNGDVMISGLPDFDNSFFNFQINNFQTTAKDVGSFLLPDATKIPIPEMLDKLGITHISGNLSGYPKDLTARLNIQSDMGYIESDVTLFQDTSTGRLDFSGNIHNSQVAFEQIFDQKILQNLDIQGLFEGSYSEQNGIELSTDLACENVVVNQQILNSVFVKGDWMNDMISAAIIVQDEYGRADFSGDFSLDPEAPNLAVEGSFTNVNVYRMKISNDTNRPLISSDFSAEIKSFDLDSLLGNVRFSNLKFALRDTVFRMNDFSFSQDISSEGILARLECDFFNADIYGNYKISKFPEMFERVQCAYIPALDTSLKHFENTGQTLHTRFEIIQTGGLFSYFLPSIQFPLGADLEMDYSDVERLDVSVGISAKNARVDDAELSNFKLEGHTQTDSLFLIRLDAESLRLSGKSYIKNIAIHAELKNNAAFWGLNWESGPDQKARIDGGLEGHIELLDKDKITFNIDDSRLMIMEQQWKFDPDNSIFIDPSGIHFKGIRFFHQDNPNEFLSLNGELSKNENSKMHLAFNQYESAPWNAIVDIGMNFSGKISGEMQLSDVYKNLQFDTDLKIDNFTINNYNYGEAHLQTSANAKKHGSDIVLDIADTSSKKPYISAKGNFSPSDLKQNLDIDISVLELDLSLLKNYVSSFSSALDGKVGGHLTLGGTLKNPTLYGELHTHDAILKVDYLNTVYALESEQILFSLDSIVIPSAKIEDTLYHTSGTISGRLKHKTFNQMRFDINVGMQRLFALNTAQWMNEDYFGKVFASGNTRISGTPENVLIDVNGKTERGTEIRLNYNSQVDVSGDNQFVRFISKKDMEDSINLSTTVSEQSSSLLTVRLNIEATPDATVSFDMNVPPTVGEISATGSGNLRLNVNAQGDFTMFGDYVLQEGYYDFSFEEQSLGRLITRRFNIERGGTLQWTGDPANMLMNISAVYSTRASLYPILSTGYSSATDMDTDISRKVNVQSVINLSGRMSQPGIKFDFRLPNIDEDKRTEFFSLLNREDENEMSKQTVFLLFFNSFTAPGNNSNVPTNSSGTNTASILSEILANQLNNIFQNFGSNVSLGVNWKPEDITTTQQTQVSMSTQFFDNRLLIDGHVSQGGLSKELQTEGQEFMGEVNMEYRITNRFSVKAFNRSNERDLVTENRSGYSQGIGISFKRDFDSLRDAFFRRRKKSVESK